MESLTDEEIIPRIMDMPVGDIQDPNDSCAYLNVSPKEAFLAIETLKITCCYMRKIY